MISSLPELRRRLLRVLIVDDEPRLRELLMDVVPEMGFTATAARNAEEALRALESEPADLAIIDLNLPTMSGMELFEQLRSRWPSMQVIVLTGFGDLPSAQRAIQLGVVEFLSKPFHLIDVDRALAAARRRWEEANRLVPSTDSSSPARSDDVESTQQRLVTLAETEYLQILAALERHGHNRTAAAAALGISRRTLHYRLAHYRKFGGPDRRD